MPNPAETYLEYTAQLRTIREAIPLELVEDNDLRALLWMETVLVLTEADAKSFQIHDEIPLPDGEKLLPIVGDWKRYRPEFDAQSKLLAQQIKLTQEHIEQWLSFIKNNKRKLSREQRIIHKAIKCWMLELFALLDKEKFYFEEYYPQNVSVEDHIKYRERLNSIFQPITEKELAEINTRLFQAENQENQ